MSTTPPIDAVSAAALAKEGLRFELVDTSDLEAFSAWTHADMRGFNAPRMSEATALEWMTGVADRRTTGVYDDSGAEPHVPVATVNSWNAALTVPGDRSVDAWAISSVTVASSHRRRGIARALLESELRVAVASGCPLAMLTVSESTIYGRFGFAPAAFGAKLEIDSRKAVWTGSRARGRVQYLSGPALRTQATELVERVRLVTPGEIQSWPHLWDRMFALSTDDKELGKKLRAVRYDDENGDAQGFALFRFDEAENDYSQHTAIVHYLLAATDDAYAGLWQFLLELDLTSKVVASLRSVDEPVRWQVTDARAARQTDVSDHLWLRILDVPAALSARSYSADVSVVLDVSDDYGFAAGRFAVHIVGGEAQIAPTDAAADIELSVRELGAVYLGGVTAATLARAGRVRELAPGAVAALDNAFRSRVTPHLSIWF